MYNELSRELEQAKRRLESLVSRGASDYEIERAQADVRRLAKRGKKVEKRTKGGIDSRRDEW